MPIANHYHLEYLVSSLNVMSQKEYDRIFQIDSNDELAVKEVLRQYVLPGFLEMTEESQRKCKDSLRYFLVTKDAPFSRIIADQQESPLEEPVEPIILFVWLWDVLFGREHPTLGESEQWEVDNDRQTDLRKKTS